MSPHAPAFYPAGDTVESVIGEIANRYVSCFIGEIANRYVSCFIGEIANRYVSCFIGEIANRYVSCFIGEIANRYVSCFIGEIANRYFSCFVGFLGFLKLTLLPQKQQQIWWSQGWGPVMSVLGGNLTTGVAIKSDYLIDMEIVRLNLRPSLVRKGPQNLFQSYVTPGPQPFSSL